MEMRLQEHSLTSHSYAAHEATLVSRRRELQRATRDLYSQLEDAVRRAEVLNLNFREPRAPAGRACRIVKEHEHRAHPICWKDFDMPKAVEAPGQPFEILFIDGLRELAHT